MQAASRMDLGAATIDITRWTCRLKLARHPLQRKTRTRIGKAVGVSGHMNVFPDLGSQ
jgi:hypothetical protein